MPRGPGRYQKCLSRLVDADRALFEYLCLTCGHTWRSVFKVGPTGQRRPASPTACQLMARVWAGYGRMNGHCPRCVKRVANGIQLYGPRNRM